jgi:hypothetical protein
VSCGPRIRRAGPVAGLGFILCFSFINFIDIYAML